MLTTILSGCVLAAITVAIHAVGLALLFRVTLRLHAVPPTRVWHITRMLVLLVWRLIVIHVAEISVWALFYWWCGCFPDAESAFYFSGATYTTIGYGDLVLERPWRLLGPIEGLTGVLMCGLSAGYFFMVVNRLHEAANGFQSESRTTDQGV